MLARHSHDLLGAQQAIFYLDMRQSGSGAATKQKQPGRVARLRFDIEVE